MSVLYFAFANDEQRPLPNLQGEAQAIDRLLQPLQQQGAFQLVIDQFATLSGMMQKLALYEDELVLFHFSGHADRNLLQLEDGEAFAKGIGEQLGRCRHLALVVLNGCKTEAQVQLLHELDIPAVIATPQMVDDPKARQFSEAFFESLAYFAPLEKAFDHGKNRVLAMDEQAQFQRTLVLREGAMPYQKSTWTLSIREGYEAHAKWILPDDRGEQLSDDFKPNDLLIETLAEALAPYNEDLQRMREREKADLPVELFEKREAIVKCLPHPIGDGIRKLVAQPTDADKGKREFYDRPDSNRLRQLVLVFEIAIELMAFIMLAQLWEEMDPPEKPERGRSALRVSSEEVEPIHQFLQQSMPDLERILNLIVHLRRLFDRHGIHYFVEELADLKNLFKEGQSFYDSCLWLSRLHRSLQDWPPSDQQGRILCRPVEEHLCMVLRPLGFVVRYTFASVKNIDLIKYRHRKQPTYHHTLVSLIVRITGLGEQGVAMKRYFDSRSVLLLKGDPNQPDLLRGELNLTPFIVDENAFNPESKLAKLHFFQRHVRETDILAYRFIYLLDDLPLVVRPNDKRTKRMHHVLSGQFRRFEELLDMRPSA
jgi:hypothetical protein